LRNDRLAHALLESSSMRILPVALLCVLAGCAADDSEEIADSEEALAEARHTVIADVDNGGGVIVANRPGGFYMGRLFPGMSFDREGAWYTSKENGTSYAWGMAWGHSNVCAWIGPSRGKIGFTAGKWASAGKPGKGSRCAASLQGFLQEGDAKNLASHWNCPPPTASAHGTEKVLTKDTHVYWNVDFAKQGIDGGTLKDEGPKVAKGTHVWYRYTTRNGRFMVVFVPGVGWGYMPVGVLDRSRTGQWSFPEHPNELKKC